MRLVATLFRRTIVPCAVASVAAILAACSPSSDQPGAVSADEARQLNEAAAMLDANSVDINAVSTNESAAP